MQVIRTVDVVDTTIPVITLVGANPQTIEVGTAYVELGATASDNYDGDITGSIVIDSSTVNTAVVGSYSVTYDVTDSSGNAATQVTRTVDVVNTTAPVITLVGANPQTIEVGSPYVELGATALDNYDGDITASIVTDATSVDTSTVGSYSVTYDVTDASGNAAIQATRTVDVVDTTAPVITLVGANPQTIEVGTAYVELGATASDNYDGDITASIVIDATAVNTAVVGSYSVTYDVTDANGNAATQVTRTVDVVDTTAPVITLVGANPQTIEVGSPYVELGATAADNYDGDITASIVTDATSMDTSTVGSYSVTYDVTDASGNAAIQATRTVDVVDTTAPVITLVGANPQTIEVGTAYVELGATASDNYDGDITASIVTDATAVDTSTVGSYSVTYDVTDSSGNPAVQVIRTIDVVDTTIPVITLVGANPQTIEAGSPYVELGATASDNYDGDITASIITDASAVDTAVVGSYSVTYDVTDSSGNAAIQVTRTVDVVDTTAPVITLVGANPQTIEVGSAYVELGATALDNYDGDITGSIVIDASAVDTAAVGSYSVTYDVADSSGNAATQVTRTVGVVDTTAPVITLVGANPQTIEVGTAYSELGATASDNYDGDITGSIIIDATAVNTAVVGSYSVTYNVTDSSGTAAVQVIRTVDVVAAAEGNATPTATDDSYDVGHGSTLTVNGPGVLANDGDVDGDPLTVRLVQAPAFGTLSLNDDGSFIYVSDDDPYETLDTFVYEAVDPTGAVDRGEVTINVTNAAPVAVVDAITIDEDTSSLIEAVANDIDADGDSLAIGNGWSASVGTVSRVADASLRFDPPPDYHGPAEITYTVVDGFGGSATGQILVTVVPVNDVPVPAGDFVTVDDFEPLAIDVLGNDIDVDGDSLAIVELSTPDHGSIRITEDGLVEYDPEHGYIGTDTFLYAITDGSGESQWATVVVSVSEEAYAAGAELADSLGIDVVRLETQNADFPTFASNSMLSLQSVTLLVGTFYQSLGELGLPFTLLFFSVAVALLLGRFTNASLLFGIRPRPRYSAVLLGRESRLLIHSETDPESSVLTAFAPTERNLSGIGKPLVSNGIPWISIAGEQERGWAMADHLTLERSLESFLEDGRPARMVRRLAGRLRSGADIRQMISPRGFVVASQSGIERIPRTDVSAAFTGLSGLRPRLQSFASAVEATADLSTESRHSLDALIPIECRNFLYLSVRPDDHGEPWIVFFEYIGRRIYIVGIAKDVGNVSGDLIQLVRKGGRSKTWIDRRRCRANRVVISARRQQRERGHHDDSEGEIREPPHGPTTSNSASNEST